MAVAQQKMYFSAPGVIDRAFLDGSNVETLVARSGSVPRVLELDLSANGLYWCDPVTLEIKRSTLFGQSEELLVAGRRFCGIALDSANDTMYWSNDLDGLFAPGIYRSSLGGANPVLVVPWDGRQINAVAVDTVHQKLYWTVVNGTPRLIRRSNVDGTGAEDVVQFFGQPAPVALAIDAEGDRLYWAAHDRSFFKGGEVGRSRLDGTQVEVLFQPVLAFGITLDVPHGHVYWTTIDQTIQRADLDGSNHVVMNLGINGLRGIAIDTRPAVKVPAASAWGLVALSLAIASAGTVLLRRKRRRACHAR